MRKFYIITNEDRDPNLSVTHSIQDYIAAKGGESSFYLSNKKKWADRSQESFPSQNIDADCVLVLGGDGTLIRAARDMAKTKIPLIGVNLGTLGYLCELDKTTVFGAIDQLFEDRYELEDRIMIEGTELLKDTSGEDAFEDGAVPALNDIVVHRSGITQMVNLVIRVDGEYLTTYCGDGVIVSTPTGSTGYSMSAGGPIMDPKTKLLLITPINPQSFSMRSIVVGADADIEIMLVKRRPELDETADVSFDGDHSISLGIGGRLVIRKADVTAKIMKLNQLSFLQILRKKMQEYR